MSRASAPYSSCARKPVSAARLVALVATRKGAWLFHGDAGRRMAGASGQSGGNTWAASKGASAPSTSDCFGGISKLAVNTGRLNQLWFGLA
jgi:hypothetical protein